MKSDQPLPFLNRVVPFLLPPTASGRTTRGQSDWTHDPRTGLQIVSIPPDMAARYPMLAPSTAPYDPPRTDETNGDGVALPWGMIAPILHYCGRITKVNDAGVAQQRVLLLSAHALYILVDDVRTSPAVVRRCISFRDVDRVIIQSLDDNTSLVAFDVVAPRSAIDRSLNPYAPTLAPPPVEHGLLVAVPSVDVGTIVKIVVTCARVLFRVTPSVVANPDFPLHPRARTGAHADRGVNLKKATGWYLRNLPVPSTEELDLASEVRTALAAADISSDTHATVLALQEESAAATASMRAAEVELASLRREMEALQRTARASQQLIEEARHIKTSQPETEAALRREIEVLREDLGREKDRTAVVEVRLAAAVAEAEEAALDAKLADEELDAAEARAAELEATVDALRRGAAATTVDTTAYLRASAVLGMEASGAVARHFVRLNSLADRHAVYAGELFAAAAVGLVRSIGRGVR